MTSTPPLTAVLLYDGDCGFCARSVQFVLAHERASPHAPLHFAALESVFGRDVQARVPALRAVNSVIWYEPATTRALVRSEAALRVLAHLGGGWGVLAAIGRLVPRPLRDATYDLVARNRHRIAAPRCVVPTPSQRDRFLT